MMTVFNDAQKRQHPASQPQEPGNCACDWNKNINGWYYTAPCEEVRKHVAAVKAKQATHTSPPAPAADEMEQRFQTKRQAWEQGYQDGGSAVQHDINLIEQSSARKAREDVLLKYQNWLAKEAKIAFEGETKAFMVRLNAKLIKDIETQQQAGEP